MEIRYVRQPDGEESAIRRLLSAADDAFVPPLTDDSRATVSQAGGGRGSTSIDTYVDDCLERPLLGAFDGDRLVGFASLDAYTDSDPLAAYTPTTYVSVLLVEETYRGRGIATRIYTHLLDSLPDELPQSSISTKTWHTNRAHIAVLDALGFECVHRIEDDRAPGVDTVYYARKLS